jgi:hypothetical protein
MKVTICTNTETLRGIWEDKYPDSMRPDDEIDGEAACKYVNAFERAVTDNIPGAETVWESSFQYWNGGPGQGLYMVDAPDAGMADDAYHTAAGIARDVVAKLTADYLETDQ